jgi:hypothetical protein
MACCRTACVAVAGRPSDPTGPPPLRIERGGEVDRRRTTPGFDAQCDHTIPSGSRRKYSGGGSVSSTLTYHEATLTSRRDLTGYGVEASDGHIGKIDRASYGVGRSLLVIDTGFWILGKKRVIPEVVVARVDHDTRNVYVNMTVDQVTAAPEWAVAVRALNMLQRLVEQP